jgi:hypothetical protein
MSKYLEAKIAEKRISDPAPGSGMTASGYTKCSGAPTSWMIRLEGEKRWRRLMVWCFSNCGTLFVKVNGECLIVRETDLPQS